MKIPIGIFAVYKPSGPTSHDVVYRIRRQLPRGIKVGHAGTLDPLASGILVIGVGRAATRQLAVAVKAEKEYIATILFGKVSSTDDGEGEIADTGTLRMVDQDEFEVALRGFVGVIEQQPPVYSAVKIKGKPAYRYARKNQSIELKSRKVEIRDLRVIQYDWPKVVITITCGSGVYIRSLARDLGVALNVGAYLLALERTRVGRFTKAEALELHLFD